MKTAIAIMVFCVTAAAWGGEVYGPGGEIEGYTLELRNSSPIYPIHRGSVTIIPDDITNLLRECLEFIEDGSVDQGRALQAAIYHPLTRDGVAQDEADRAQYEAERYRRETALHGRIVEMIRKLEQK